jgi:hypothetical protein
MGLIIYIVIVLIGFFIWNNIRTRTPNKSSQLVDDDEYLIVANHYYYDDLEN